MHIINIVMTHIINVFAVAMHIIVLMHIDACSCHCYDSYAYEYCD